MTGCVCGTGSVWALTFAPGGRAAVGIWADRSVGPAGSR